MAYFLFTRSILEGVPIKLFNHGKMRRDFTYIDDAMTVILRLIDHVPQHVEGKAGEAPARIYNVGSHRPEELMHVIAILEKELGRPAIKEMLPMQAGDMVETFADIEDLTRDVGFTPQTPIEDGMSAFVKWYRGHYKV